MPEDSFDHITLAAEHDLGAAQDRLDALADQIAATEAGLAEARAVHADAVRQADLEAGS